MTARKGEAALDAWSWVHLGSGAALAFVAVPAIWAVALIVGFEGLEGLLRRVRTKRGGLFEPESWPNIIADVVVGVLGYALIRVAINWGWLQPVIPA